MDVKVELPASEKAKLSVRGLNFYYGASRRSGTSTSTFPRRKVTAFIGPSGCGKSTLLRTFNRMFELYPEQRAEGSILLDGEDVLTSRGRRVPHPGTHRHGVPEAHSLPDVDL